MSKSALTLIFSFLFLFCYSQKIKYNSIGCKITNEEKTSIERMAKYEFEFYDTILVFKKIPKVNVSVYGNYKAFMRSQRSSPSYGQSESGYCMIQRKGVFVYKDSNFVRTCFHETSHFILGSAAPGMPTWINEGLAKYFEYLKFDTANKILIQPWKYGKRRMKFLIAKNKIHLSWLVSASYKKFHKRNNLDHYVESWSIIYFLMQKNRFLVKEILQAIASGADSRTTINQNYSGGIDQLQKDIIVFYQ